MKWHIEMLASLLAMLALATPAVQAQSNLEADLNAVRDAWSIANYRTAGDERKAAFEKLVAQSAKLVATYPQRAEALIWDGIVLSTYAGVKGGLGALGPAKQAKERFESALALDEKALDGSAHTSIGTLYHKVPGFPVAFGSDKKARMHLEKSLQINPAGIDPNFFYGEFLYDEGEYGKALEHLERALKAPSRPGREIADEGRRQEIQALITRTKAEMN